MFKEHMFNVIEFNPRTNADLSPPKLISFSTFSVKALKLCRSSAPASIPLTLTPLYSVLSGSSLSFTSAIKMYLTCVPLF